MARPLVAIVGRPNVGKSTFFNRMCARQSAIVEDTPGVTRDRIFGETDWLNYKFTLVDTGGIEPSSDDIILKQMRRQAELAIEACDVIMFFVDAKQGLVPADYQVAEMLRKSDKPVIVVVNKVETADDKDMVYDFYSLGLGDICSISSSQGLGFGDLLDEVVKHFPSPNDDEDESEIMHIALVGKPNVGKSSFINRITGTRKAKVEDRPGVTVDKQWVQSPIGLDLLDMPGVLWPKFEDQTVGENLAMTGAIKDAVLDIEDIAARLCGRLRTLYPAEFAARYKLTPDDFAGKENYEIFEMIGRKRGFLVSGGDVSGERTAVMLLDEFRAAKIGRFTLERPGKK